MHIKNAKDITITGTNEEIKGRILIEESQKVTLENINIDRGLTKISDWQTGDGKAYGIQIYCSNNVKLNNVNIKNSNAGLQVNSSIVEVNDMEISNVGFGGIEVSIGKEVPDSYKTSNLKYNNVTLGQEDSNKNIPVIWTDGNKESTVEYNGGDGGKELSSTVTVVEEKNQVWYTVKIDQDSETSDTNKDEVDTNKQEVDTNKQESDTNKQEVDTNKQESDTNKQESDTNKQESDTNKQEVDTNKQEADTNKQEADTNKQESDTNKQESDTNK